MSTSTIERVQTLSDWLNKLSKNILNLPSSKIKQQLRNKINHQYVPSIQSKLNKRKRFLKYYKHIIDTPADFFKIPIRRDSDWSLNMYHEDLPDSEKRWVKIHKGYFKYSDMREQSLIPFLTLSHQIYEKCIEMSLIINDPSVKEVPDGTPSILLNWEKGKRQYKEFFKKHRNALIELKRKYGYELGFIIRLRNIMIHGQTVLDDKDIFVSETGSDKDRLNSSFIDNISKEILNKYQLSNPRNVFRLARNDELSSIIDICLPQSDQYVGYFLHNILKEK